MRHCKQCKSEIEDGIDSCPVCGIFVGDGGSNNGDDSGNASAVPVTNDDAFKSESSLENHKGQEEAGTFPDNDEFFGDASVSPDESAINTRLLRNSEGHPEFPNSLMERFEKPEPLKSGGNAFVWKALEKSPRRIVAIKVPRNTNYQYDVKRSEDEADLLSSLNRSPNIVTLYSVYGSVLVMEYMEKGSLEDIIPWRVGMTEEEAFPIVTDVLASLEYIHRMGVLHLDIKVSNILLNDENAAKLSDFGFARRVVHGGVRPEGLTPTYAPPEQNYTHKSDLYQFGLTVVAMLTGNVKQPKLSIKDAREKASSVMRRLIDALVADEPSERHEARDLLKTLSRGLTEQRTSRRPKKLPPLQVQWHTFAELEAMTAERIQHDMDSLPEWAKQMLQRIDEILGPEQSDWRKRHLYEKGRLPQWLAREGLKGEEMNSFFTRADRELCRTWVIEDLLHDDPSWFYTIRRLQNAKIARVFLLHGNINDLSFHPDKGYLPLSDFLAAEFGDSLSQYNLSQGVRPKQVSGDTPSEDSGLWQRIITDFRRLGEMVRADKKSVIVIHGVDKLFPAGISDLEREFIVEMIVGWATDSHVPYTNCIILTTQNYDGLHPDLRSRANRISSIEVPRPDQKDRLKFLIYKWYSMQAGSMGNGRTRRITSPPAFAPLFGSSLQDQIKSFSNVSAGLSLMGLEDLLIQSHSEGALIEMGQIASHKRSLLAGESAGLLEMVSPRYGFKDVGGLENVIERLKEVCFALHSMDPAVRSTIPMGVLFAGPPGTGKSLVAEALAKESGVTFVKLGNVRDMYVGQSEKNLTTALQLVRTLSPVIVFIDELDLAMGKRSRGVDSGPEARLFANMLEFMSDQSLRGQVVWIGATNMPSEIDPALMRAGRFDLKLGFFLPAPDERRNILKIHCDRLREHVTLELEESDLDELSGEVTKNFSGAELQVVVTEAVRLAVRERMSSISDDKGVVLRKGHFDSFLAGYNPETSIKRYLSIERTCRKELGYSEQEFDES